MKVTCKWKENLRFMGTAGKHIVPMDTRSPLGSDSAASPKQLLLISICGCSGMDVVSLLKKYKENLVSCEVEADAPLTEGYPSIFAHIDVTFKVGGPRDAEKVLEAVKQSMTMFCGVSAMIHPTSPIRYKVELDGKKIGEGVADFPPVANR